MKNVILLMVGIILGCSINLILWTTGVNAASDSQDKYYKALWESWYLENPDARYESQVSGLMFAHRKKMEQCNH